MPDSATKTEAAASSAPLAKDLSLTPAENSRQEGNSLFKAGRFWEALAAYRSAAQCAPSAAIWCNISLACLRVAEFEAALDAAQHAVSFDSTNQKALFRRACAYAELQQHAKAIADFEAVAALNPQDSHVAGCLANSRRSLAQQRFAAAVRCEERVLSWRTVESIAVADSYAGPQLPRDPIDGKPRVTREFVRAAMAHVAAGGVIPKAHLLTVALLAAERLRTEATVNAICVPPGARIAVCGDTHGQLGDVLHIFRRAGEPSATRLFLFNGDFVDRGPKSVEVLFVLLCWKAAVPQGLFLNRGNHESIALNAVYGFAAEVRAKYGADAFELLTQVFPALPLAHTVNRHFFVTHGGLGPDAASVDVSRIARINRHRAAFRSAEDGGAWDDAWATHLLWADPATDAGFVGHRPSSRGTSVCFGADITAAFLARNNLQTLIRSHEFCADGFRVDHAGRCITIFSAANYMNGGNRGAYVDISAENTHSFVQFDAADAAECLSSCP